MELEGECEKGAKNLGMCGGYKEGAGKQVNVRRMQSWGQAGEGEKVAGLSAGLVLFLAPALL